VAERLRDGDPRIPPAGTIAPDGSRVALVDGQSLVVSAVDGGARRIVASGDWFAEAGNPLWSPSGDRIALETRRDEIQIVDVATGKATLLATIPGVGPRHLIRFSPEGDRLLFWRSDSNDVPGLWSVDVDWTNLRLLVAGTFTGDWQRTTTLP
jgi:Tol biopolymer transport system component